MCVCVRRFTTDLVFLDRSDVAVDSKCGFHAKDGAAEGGERGLKCAFTLHL